MSARRQSEVAISHGAGARGSGTVLSDLALGVRMAAAGGRGGWSRLILTAIGIGLIATVLLLAASFGPALDSRQTRTDGMTPHYLFQPPTPGTDDDSTTGGLNVPGRFEAHQSEIAYRGTPVRGTDLAALPANVSAIPSPPGVTRVPAPGQLVLSPELAVLLASADGAELSRRLTGEVIGSIDPAGLVDPAELRFYRGAPPISGWWADNQLADGWGIGDDPSAFQQPSAPYEPVLLAAGSVIVLTPLLIFVSLLSRLGGPGRDSRSAMIRLLGGSTRQLRRITMVETGFAAVAGLVLGALGYAFARQWAPSLTIGPGAFFLSDITPSPATAVAIVVIVPLLATAAVWWGSRRVIADPLGVTRDTQRPPRPWKGLALFIFGVVAMVGSMVQGVLAGQWEGIVLMSLAVVALLLTVSVLLPSALGAVVRCLPTKGVAWQLAVRRLQLDSSTPARVVAGVCVVLAGAIALQPLITLLSADRTGSSDSGARPPAYRVYVMDSRNVAELSEVIDVLVAADGVDAVVGGIPIGGTVGAITPPNQDGSLDMTGSFLMDVTTCAAIPEVPDCRDGQVFAVQQPVNLFSDTNSITLGRLSQGAAVSLNGNGEQPVTVSLPPLTGTIVPDPSRYVDGQTTLLITPGALGTAADQLVAGTGMDLRVVSADPSSATADHIRTDLADQTWRPSVITTAEATGDRGQFTATARAALRVAALLTLLVAAAGVLVMSIEQLIVRRRALTFSIASGVPRTMIARSLVISGIIPILVGVALAAVIGSVLSAFLFTLVGHGWQPNWGLLGAFSATAVLLVGLSCLAALPLLTVLTRPDAIRTG